MKKLKQRKGLVALIVLGAAILYESGHFVWWGITHVGPGVASYGGGDYDDREEIVSEHEYKRHSYQNAVMGFVVGGLVLYEGIKRWKERNELDKSWERTKMNFSSLNDACWSSIEVRTEAMLPLIAAFKDWREWDQSHVNSTVELIAIQTVKRVIADMDCLPEETRNQCRNADNITTAFKTAQVASAYALMKSGDEKSTNREADRAACRAIDNASWAASFAGWGAKYLGNVTSFAGRAAAYAAEAALAEKANPDTVLRAACQLWIDAARDGALIESEAEAPGDFG